MTLVGTATFPAVTENVPEVAPFGIIKDAGITGACTFVSATLHRKWRGWLDGRFNEALLDSNHTHFHAQHGADASVPDNIDQRVQESIKGLTGGAIGLAMGIMAVASSLFFVGQKLISSSTEVAGLEFLGDYGSAVLTFAAVAAYVPVNTWIAIKLGGLLERLSIGMQKAEGSYRGELTTFLRRSFHVAASRGVPTRTFAPRRAASGFRLSGWRDEISNSCPALAHSSANAPPIRPVPMMPMRKPSDAPNPTPGNAANAAVAAAARIR